MSESIDSKKRFFQVSGQKRTVSKKCHFFNLTRPINNKLVHYLFVCLFSATRGLPQDADSIQMNEMNESAQWTDWHKIHK